MKKILLSSLILAYGLSCGDVWAQDEVQVNFDEYFFPRTLRYDYYHGGTADSEQFYFKELIAEPYWGGSKTSLVDQTNLGDQRFCVRDKKSGKVIYSLGYNTIFNEWADTEEAHRTSKAMPESVVMPMPKDSVTIELYTRNRDKSWNLAFSHDIDPNSYFVRTYNPSYQTFEVLYSGSPEHCVDIVLLPEGYTEEEKDIFIEDCRNFVSDIMSFYPYSQMQDKFNVRGVWAPSKDSGVTIPGEHIWRTTPMDARFYTFDSERYQTIEDFHKVRDLAAAVPYDAIYVLSNTSKYGGGGIYNFYGISAAHNKASRDKIYVHEFGHSFAGLGDEYVGNVNYSDMYHPDSEPWEPNLTTLYDFDQKPYWKRLVEENKDKNKGKNDGSDHGVGLYEGGGYVSEGVYRPSVTCLMKEFPGVQDFCPVCSQAIIDRINILTE